VAKQSSAFAYIAETDGQTMAEYALILAVITTGVLLAVAALAAAVGIRFTDVTNLIVP
jgi:Flp pilus assembly pilin Flp